MVAFERILTLNDPRVEEYRGVAEPELLRSRGRFIAEGRLIVARLLTDPQWKVRSVLVSDAAARDLSPALASVPGVPIFVTSAANFLGITGHNIHRGCLALVERPPATALAKVLGARLLLVLENVTNADNVGGVFRNAAAFGVEAVVLSPRCCSPLYRKAIRTSMGAVLRVPFVHVEAWPAPLEEMRQAGFAIAALVAAPGERPIETLQAFTDRQPFEKLALLIGSEGPGLTPDAQALADHRVHIPTEPLVDSLNLAVAAGIALEQLTRGRRGRGILAGRIEPES